MNDVTVVIPAYKAEATIERAVRSVLGQPGVKVQVVVVIDDLSTETRKRVELIEDPRIDIIMNEKNSGAPFSRNAGLQQVQTSFVLFLDSDDYLTGDLLAGLAHVLADGNLDVAFGPWIRMDERVNLCERFVPRYSSAEEAMLRWMIDKTFTAPCSVMWRTQSVRRFGGWDEALRRNQDGELVMRALLMGAAFGHSQQGAGVYWKHGSEHRITSSRSNFDSLIAGARKLHALPSTVILNPVKSKILGAYLYKVAVMAFESGDVRLGREALGLARNYGFTGHRGKRMARLGAGMLGLERYHRITGSLARVPDLG